MPRLTKKRAIELGCWRLALQAIALNRTTGQVRVHPGTVIGAVRGCLGRVPRGWLGRLRKIAELRAERYARSTSVHDPLTKPFRSRVKEILTRVAEREEARRKAIEARMLARVKAAYDTCQYRRSRSRWAGGEHSLTVQADTIARADGGSTAVWSSNGKWRGTNSWHTITVPTSWSCLRKDFRVIESRLVLDAKHEGTHTDGTRVYSGCWVAQGSGFSLRLDRGSIIVKPDGTKRLGPNLAVALSDMLRTKLRGRLPTGLLHDAAYRRLRQIWFTKRSLRSKTAKALLTELVQRHRPSEL